MSIFSSNDKDTLKAAPIPERLKKNKRVLILTADNTEDLEFFYPYYRLNEAGYEVDVATENGKPFKAKHGYEFKQVKKLSELSPLSYALLYIPGGKAPAALRKEESVIRFVKDFARTGAPVAAICHGPQVLITAELVSGRRMACWPEVREELEKAGGRFVDEALVEDGQFITGRMPGDLHRFMCGVMDYLEGRKSASKAA